MDQRYVSNLRKKSLEESNATLRTRHDLERPLQTVLLRSQEVKRRQYFKTPGQVQRVSNRDAINIKHSLGNFTPRRTCTLSCTCRPLS